MALESLALLEGKYGFFAAAVVVEVSSVSVVVVVVVVVVVEVSNSTGGVVFVDLLSSHVQRGLAVVFGVTGIGGGGCFVGLVTA